MNVTPLIFDGVLGIVVGAFTRRVVVRVILWLLIPLVVAVLLAGPQNFTLQGGEPSMVWWVFTAFFGLGVLASGVGMLIGYFLRRDYKKS